MAKRRSTHDGGSLGVESRVLSEPPQYLATESKAEEQNAIVLGLTDEGDVNLRIPLQELRTVLGARSFNTPTQTLLERIEERLGEEGTTQMLHAALAVVASSADPQPRLHAITGMPDPRNDEAARAAAAVTTRSRVSRDVLLADAVSTTEAGQRLHLTRQGVTERIKRGNLLALRTGRGYRLPPWQFDDGTEDGLVPGLPLVLHDLSVSPLAQASWLTRPSPYLNGETPLAVLKRGDIAAVAAEARAVGAAEW